MRVDVVSAAQQLFEQFYAECFWHMPSGFRVKLGDIPIIIKGLRTFGGHRGFVAAASLTIPLAIRNHAARLGS